jgi:hypothetical protein
VGIDIAVVSSMIPLEERNKHGRIRLTRRCGSSTLRSLRIAADREELCYIHVSSRWLGLDNLTYRRPKVFLRRKVLARRAGLGMPSHVTHGRVSPIAVLTNTCWVEKGVTILGELYNPQEPAKCEPYLRLAPKWEFMCTFSALGRSSALLQISQTWRLGLGFLVLALCDFGFGGGGGGDGDCKGRENGSGNGIG